MNCCGNVKTNARIGHVWSSFKSPTTNFHPTIATRITLKGSFKRANGEASKFNLPVHTCRRSRIACLWPAFLPIFDSSPSQAVRQKQFVFETGCRIWLSSYLQRQPRRSFSFAQLSRENDGIFWMDFPRPILHSHIKREMTLFNLRRNCNKKLYLESITFKLSIQVGVKSSTHAFQDNLHYKSSITLALDSKTNGVAWCTLTKHEAFTK